jgi:hypothetical protein
MTDVALDLTSACAGLGALTWALALVARADRGFHFRGPAARQPYLLQPLKVLRLHAREANLCDACGAAPWDYRTREDEYLCRACAPRAAKTGVMQSPPR